MALSYRDYSLMKPHMAPDAPQDDGQGPERHPEPTQVHPRRIDVAGRHRQEHKRKNHQNDAKHNLSPFIYSFPKL